jgi:hypothetical protein
MMNTILWTLPGLDRALLLFHKLMLDWQWRQESVYLYALARVLAFVWWRVEVLPIHVNVL